MSNGLTVIIEQFFLGSGAEDRAKYEKEKAKRIEEGKKIDLDTFDKLSPTDMDKYGMKALGLNEDYFDIKLLSEDGSGQKFRELEFFIRNDGKIQGTFFEHISRHCQTNIGKLYLKLMLLNVTEEDTNRVNSVNFKYTVEAIKNIVQEMKEEDARREKGVEIATTHINGHTGLPDHYLCTGSYTFDDLIRRAGRYESEVLSLYQPDSDELKQILESIFFTNKFFEFLNYQNNVMGVYYLVAIYIAPAYCIVSPLVIMFAPYIVLKYVLGLNVSFMQYWNMVNGMFFQASGVTKIVEKGVNHLNSQLAKDDVKDKYSLTFRLAIKTVALTLKLINSAVGKYSYVLFIFVCYCFAVYNAVNNSRSLDKIMKYFHKKLHAVYWSTRLAKHINDTNLVDYAAITGHHVNIKNIFKEGSFYNDLIKDPTICDQYDLFSKKGPITTMYKRLRDEFELVHNNTDHIMNYIAVADCHNAIARLYYNLERDNKPVSFAQFIFSTATVNEDDDVNGDEEKQIDMNTFNRPILMIDDDVHNICCDDVVCNNVMYDGKNTMVITGPNGSGKSTHIKAIMESIIMAQTFGIAFASEMTLTPFTYLTTYLNIPDCQGKESLFQAEMSRCHKFLGDMDEHEKDRHIQGKLYPMFSFNIIDEIFVSTNYKEGMSAAGAVINKLSKYNKCLNIVITHFDLKDVCKDNVDYKYFTIDDDLECDYKIRDGVNDKHMALKLLKKKGFDNELVDEATEIYEELFTEKPNKEPENKEDENDDDEEEKIEEEYPKRLKGG